MKAHTKMRIQPKAMLHGALAALVLCAMGGPAVASTGSTEDGESPQDIKQGTMDSKQDMADTKQGTADTKQGTSDTKQELVKDAQATVESFRQADPGLEHFFSGAIGYAVFPSVAKGGAGVGGAYGQGVLFEHERPIGRTTLTQVTVGPQLGGQAYSEIVFFENAAALAAFKKGQLTMSAQVSAVVANNGASANARYARGVAVFTEAKAGLMAEASVGGQRFGYKPFRRAM